MDEVNIRKMERADRKTVLRIARKSFPPLELPFFSLTKHVLVAETEGEIQGGIVLKTFSLPKNGKGGVINWIFTRPEVRGTGIGGQLIDAGLVWLEEAGCTQVFSIVEGFNTSSSKLFASRGFSILPFKEQIRRFGLAGIPKVWWACFHFLDLGHFLWSKPPTEIPDESAPQFFGTLILNALIGFLAVWRAWGFGLRGISALWMIPLVILYLIEFRTLLMALTARKHSLNLRFRMWESGSILATLLALAFGFYLPVPGSLYPRKDIWHQQELAPQYGRIAFSGVLPALIFSWLIFFILNLTLPPPWIETVLTYSLGVSSSFAAFDILLPFFPFTSFNGRRLWDWNKTYWGILAAATIALVILMKIA